MSTTEFTPRNVTKYVAAALVHARVARFTEDVITDYTRFEEDDTIVEISSHVVGWYVSSKLRPVTDKVVDRAADFIVEKRENRAAKKNAPEQ